MERDKKLEQIVKEHGLISAPDNFSDVVLDKIREPLPFTYKPLIGKGGKIFIIIFIVSILAITIYSATLESAEPVLIIPEWDFKIPEIGWKLPSGLLAGLIALFVLALTDAGLNRSRAK
ncbi:hypothetical protein ACFLQX_01025 [Bacteroidota bacterium]